MICDEYIHTLCFSMGCFFYLLPEAPSSFFAQAFATMQTYSEAGSVVSCDTSAGFVSSTKVGDCRYIHYTHNVVIVVTSC